MHCGSAIVELGYMTRSLTYSSDARHAMAWSHSSRAKGGWGITGNPSSQPITYKYVRLRMPNMVEGKVPVR